MRAWLGALCICVGAVVVLFAGPARADKHPPTKIYFDADSGRFNAPLSTGGNKQLEIFTILPKGSVPEFVYWPRPEQGCPSPNKAKRTQALPPGARVVSALAVPGAEGQDQRFVTHVGPLLLNAEYCFKLRGYRSSPIDSAAKAQIAQATRNAIELVAEWTRARERPYTKACADEVAQQSAGSVSSCEVAKAFVEVLPKSLRGLRVAGGKDGLDMETGFRRALDEDDNFHAALEALLRSFDGVKVRYDDVEQALEDIGTLAQADLLYSPIGALTYADLRRAGGKKLFPDRGQVEGKDLASLVWKHRKRLHSAGSWRKLAEPKQTHLREFVSESDRSLRSVQPTFYGVTRHEFAKLLSEIPTLPADKGREHRGAYKFTAETAAAALGVIKLNELRKLPGWSARPNITEMEQYILSLGALARGSKRISDALAQELDLDVLTRFTAKISQIHRFETINQISVDTNFDTRFPMYASADIGIAVAALPLRNNRARAEVVTYFGLAIYFTALDKDEPLNRRARQPLPPETRGRNFLRRFSVTAGISMTPPRLNDDLGVSGVVGKQVALAGVGLRVTDYFRIGLGSMFYKQTSPNPLSDLTTLRAAPYFSASIDVDVIGTVRGWFEESKKATSP